MRKYIGETEGHPLKGMSLVFKTKSFCSTSTLQYKSGIICKEEGKSGKDKQYQKDSHNIRGEGQSQQVKNFLHSIIEFTSVAEAFISTVLNII